MKTKTKINKVLIYKRTHPNDPRKEGIFGVEDCLKSRRNEDFDLVIGIGGDSQTKKAFSGMKRQINWVGVYPTRVTLNPALKYKLRGKEKQYSDVMTFPYFALYEEVYKDGSASFWGEVITQKTYPALFTFCYTPAQGKQKPWSQRARKIDLSDPTMDAQLKEEIMAIVEKAIKYSQEHNHVQIKCKKTIRAKCVEGKGGNCPPQNKKKCDCIC